MDSVLKQNWLQELPNLTTPIPVWHKNASKIWPWLKRVSIRNWRSQVWQHFFGLMVPPCYRSQVKKIQVWPIHALLPFISQVKLQPTSHLSSLKMPTQTFNSVFLFCVLVSTSVMATSRQKLRYSIDTLWNGDPIDHPGKKVLSQMYYTSIKLQIALQDNNLLLMTLLEELFRNIPQDNLLVQLKLNWETPNSPSPLTSNTLYKL